MKVTRERGAAPRSLVAADVRRRTCGGGRPDPGRWYRRRPRLQVRGASRPESAQAAKRRLNSQAGTPAVPATAPPPHVGGYGRGWVSATGADRPVRGARAGRGTSPSPCLRPPAFARTTSARGAGADRAGARRSCWRSDFRFRIPSGCFAYDELSVFIFLSPGILPEGVGHLRGNPQRFFKKVFGGQRRLGAVGRHDRRRGGGTGTETGDLGWNTGRPGRRELAGEFWAKEWRQRNGRAGVGLQALIGGSIFLPPLFCRWSGVAFGGHVGRGRAGLSLRFLSGGGTV